MSYFAGINPNEEFSIRLRSFLKEKNRTLSPTALARDFNLRWRGAPVSVNAVRKWLMGEAIPTLDKLEVLASLLDTSKELLRWGVNPSRKLSKENLNQSAYCFFEADQDQNRAFLQDYGLLTKNNKKIIDSNIKVILNNQKNDFY
jgi:hypothetical protein